MKKKKEVRNRPYSVPNDVVSANECTGLTQFVPENDEQNASFEDIYDIPISDGKHAKDK